MIRSSLVHLFPLLASAALHAAEVVIEERPFTIEADLTAALMPENGVMPLRIDAKTWEDFRIVELASHGASVAKGGLLVRFDAAGIDRKIADTQRSVSAAGLALARMEHEFKTLQETAPHKLAALRQAAEIAKEEHAYFTKTRRKATEETAAQKLERKKQMLSNQQEELTQLAKMYEADDITENTEEIILTRQKDDVAAAEFALRMETLNYQRSLEVELPREAIALANNERDAAIALRTAEEEIPRALEMKKLELSALKTQLQREKETLAELEHDRAFFEIKAPAAGVFYHGPIEDGRWSPGEITKNLVMGGRPAILRSFGSFIPATSKLMLVAFLDEAEARSLKPELSGTATLTGREDIEIPVKLARLATVPNPEGGYRADFSAVWPNEPAPVTGASARIRMITYHRDRAIFVPSEALSRNADGWTVEVKLTDGKTERRPVKHGRVSGDQTEILGGLEVGQVIVAP